MANKALTKTEFSFKGQTAVYHGKVRDVYTINDDIMAKEQQEQLGIQEWLAVHGEEPFIDAEELCDPRLHLWRETLRQRYNFNTTRNDRRTDTD